MSRVLASSPSLQAPLVQRRSDTHTTQIPGEGAEEFERKDVEGSEGSEDGRATDIRNICNGPLEGLADFVNSSGSMKNTGRLFHSDTFRATVSLSETLPLDLVRCWGQRRTLKGRCADIQQTDACARLFSAASCVASTLAEPGDSNQAWNCLAQRHPAFRGCSKKCSVSCEASIRFATSLAWGTCCKGCTDCERP